MKNRNIRKQLFSLFFLLRKIKGKAYTFTIKWCFANFGSRSTIIPPLRLKHPHQISFGDNVFIGPNSWFQSIKAKNDDNVAILIKRGTSAVGNLTISAAKQITIEENVLLANNVYISDHSHHYAEKNKPILKQGITKIKPVCISRGTWIGQNVVIGPGVTIGMGTVVGANSFVNKDIPDYCVAVGSPAKVIKKF